LEILEFNQIDTLVDASLTVINCGGGGIPVSQKSGGRYFGVEAVIDKELTSNLLAAKLKADYFILITGVEKVALDFGRPEQRWLDNLKCDEALTLFRQSAFTPGSMAPKIDAMIRFFSRQEGAGIITNPDKKPDTISGKTGTHFTLSYCTTRHCHIHS
jgi:carbamate kinase